MPDKKLTDSEIVKGLECHSRPSNSCGSNCPYLMCEEVMCTKKLSKDALELITRLQAENERLQKFKSYFDFYYGCDIEILGIDENGDTTSFDEFYNCAIANAESIEHHIAHIIKTAKAEAYKEFAERLKKNITDEFNYYDEQEYPRATISDIDNLLKELVGEDDGKEEK